MRIVLIFIFIGIQIFSQAKQVKPPQLEGDFSSTKRKTEKLTKGEAAQALSITENFHRQTPRDHSSPLSTD